MSSTPRRLDSDSEDSDSEDDESLHVGSITNSDGTPHLKAYDGDEGAAGEDSWVWITVCRPKQRRGTAGGAATRSIISVSKRPSVCASPPKQPAPKQAAPPPPTYSGSSVLSKYLAAPPSQAAAAACGASAEQREAFCSDIDMSVFFTDSPWCVAGMRERGRAPQEGHRQILADMELVVNAMSGAYTPEERGRMTGNVSALALGEFVSAFASLTTDAAADAAPDSEAAAARMFADLGTRNGVAEPLRLVERRSRPRRSGTVASVANALADGSTLPRLVSLIGPFTAGTARHIKEDITKRAHGVVKRVGCSIVIALAHNRRAYVDWRPIYGDSFKNWQLRQHEGDNELTLMLVPVASQ